MKRMGIDASTKCTGYCIFEDKKLIKYNKIEIIDSNTDWRDRVVYMMKELSSVIIKEEINQVCIEVPIKTIQNVNTLEQLFSLHGAILGMCVTLGVEVIPVEVNKWRKDLHLLSNIPKDENKRAILKERSIKLANELYGLDLVWKSPNSKKNDDDISDSILICHSVIHENDRGFGFLK